MPLDPKTERSVAGDPALREQPVVRCGRCGATVAEVDDRIVVGDASLHTFVNPDGLVFRLTCYARADGCAAIGEPSTQWTWFPGHAWRVALCRACGEQLGWHFAGAAVFWGLIDDRVTIAPADDDG